ncbi:hypothetical protein [Marinobacter sp. P4B1]|uniref:hypothetical protein n=1 Tax=Marinobacter sp. P4B1 TaxID=1119533 RepID=UPI00071DE7FF|nr:hypothetical protein [Marinobacter sp. P4B1]KRW83698.1 hypothetical protein AQ621_16750 [Marinobacter sp. P4B1]
MEDKRKPVTEDDLRAIREFMERNPRVSEILPATLPCGFKVTDYHPICSSCEQEIPGNWAWVSRQRQQFGGRVVEVWEAKGVCTDCRYLTNTLIRFRSDGTFDSLIGHQWKTGTIRNRKSGKKAWARRLLSRLFGI